MCKQTCQFCPSAEQKPGTRLQPIYRAGQFIGMACAECTDEIERAENIYAKKETPWKSLQLATP